MNSFELARNKFNALFAAHDAKDIRAGAEEQKPTLDTVKKEEKKRRTPLSTDQKRGFDHMTSGNKCKVKDDLVNQLIALNNKLNNLSAAFLRSEVARAEVQELREALYIEIKRHRAKGHEGKRCPAA